jgi:hypothetical protein
MFRFTFLSIVLVAGFSCSKEKKENSHSQPEPKPAETTKVVNPEKKVMPETETNSQPGASHPSPEGGYWVGTEKGIQLLGENGTVLKELSKTGVTAGIEFQDTFIVWTGKGLLQVDKGSGNETVLYAKASEDSKDGFGELDMLV